MIQVDKLERYCESMSEDTLRSWAEDADKMIEVMFQLVFKQNWPQDISIRQEVYSILRDSYRHDKKEA